MTTTMARTASSWGFVLMVAAAVAGCGSRESSSTRGSYLAGIMGCAPCHTAFGPSGPALDMLYGGGLDMPLSVGTWRSPNISPDPETGIGKWTDTQIIAAVREGKRPDGSQMSPIMPYPFFAALSDDDAQALVQFLRSNRAVPNKIERLSSALPAPSPRAPMNPTPPRTDRIKYGEYLANAMMCGLCHTPLDSTGTFDLARPFVGGGLEVLDLASNWSFVGPNLTPHPTTGLGQWSEEDIASGIMEMRRPDGRPIGGPMRLFSLFWGQMPRADALAIAAYLKSLPPVDHLAVSHWTDPSKAPPEATSQPTTLPVPTPTGATAPTASKTPEP